MVLRIVIFLAVILALTIGSHLLFYRAVVRLFVITSPAFKFSLFIALFLLSLSFMASFFLLHWQENLATTMFYMLSATWTGLFLNLLLAIPACWIIIGSLRITGHHPNTGWITAGCLLAAFLFSAYGMWNAYHPRLKNVDIVIENLPEGWKNKTLVHLSDVHLGHFFGTTFLNNLSRKVNALNPDLIFVTGDLFDGMASSISHFAEGLNNFRAKKGVIFVTGNHETYVGVSRARDVLKKTDTIILNNEIIDIDGLQVIGISYPGIRSLEDIRGLEDLRQNSADNSPRILLFHTPTNIAPKAGDGLDRHFATYWIPDTSFSTSKKLGVNLQLSGHTHAGQIFPFGYLTKVIYKGYDYGHRRLGNFSIYTTSGVGTWGPPMRTGNSPEIVAINLK